MLRSAVSALVLLCSAASLAAVPLPANCFGTAGSEVARAIVAAPNGGWYLAGHSSAVGGADTNLLVIRVDSLGIPLWARTNAAVSSFSGSDVITSAAADIDGGAVFTGRTSSFGAFRPPLYVQNSDVFLFKLDPAGNLVWARTYGTSGNDRAWSVCRTVLDPGFIIAGSTDSGSTRWITVIKTDPFGVRQWQRRYRFRPYLQEGLSIVETGDPSYRYALCGRANIGSPNDYDAFLTTLDALGLPAWPYGVLTVEGSGNDEAWSVAAMPGFITVAGWSDSYGSGGGPDADILVFHSNMGGTMLNPRVIGWSGFEEKVMGDRALARDSLGTATALAGWTYAKGPGAPVYPNMLMMKIDGGSNAISWSRLHPSVPGELGEQAFAVARARQSYAIAGYTASHWSFGAEDFHLVTLDSLGNRPFCTLDSTPFVRSIPPAADTLVELPLVLDDSLLGLMPTDIGFRAICTLAAAVADVGVNAIIAPLGTIDSGTTVVPACSVDNFGPVAASYSVRCRIGGFYDQVAAVTGHAAGTRIGVTFTPWTATQVGGPHIVSCSTELAGDPNSANNRQLERVVVRQPGGRDVGCTHIISPVGIHDSGATVTPACSVRNYGVETVTYTVRMRIGTGYDQTAAVNAHAPGTARLVSFPAWVAQPVGVSAVACSTELDSDNTPANDRLDGTVRVQRLGPDVGVTRIAAPSGIVPLGAIIVPVCSTYNWGNTTATYGLRLVSSTGYDATVTVTGHAPGTALRVLLPTWAAGPAGSVDFTAWTTLAGDLAPANDTARGTCAVVSTGGTGWQEVAPMPLLPSGKPVKDGAWLAFSAGNGLLYAAKGNKTGDFYYYSPVYNTWVTLPFIPDGVEGKPVGKGAAGAADGNNSVYCIKGNNTLGFWRYDIAAGTWHQLADVPLGPTNKRVKGGGDLAWVGAGDGAHVYLLKGLKNEFWRYSIAADTWLPLPAAPGRISPKWDRGSFIVFDGAGAIYAHKAKFHELHRFDIGRSEWDTLPQLAGMPLLSRSGQSKRSKDGGSGTWYSDGIFALKGGNTQEFWRWFASGDSWREYDTVPAVGTTGKKKRIKAGADVTAVGGGLFYALKGNKTVELWRYLLAQPPDARPAVESRAGVMAAPAARPAGFAVGPSPTVAGYATLRYSLPSSGPASVRVYDVTGRGVLTRSLVAGRTGTVSLDLRELSAGVYLVKLTSADFTASQKLVVER